MPMKASRSKSRQPFRIVIIEDNPGDVYLLEKALSVRKIPYALITYLDGAHAMKGISDGTFGVPDLILVDLNLPRRDGFDVLSTIRADSRLTGIPLAVLTSSNSTKDVRWAASLGADHYITKPGTLEEFIDQVGGAVEGLLNSSS